MDFTRPKVMGILNVTPDSFSDGGRFLEPAAALEQAVTMVEQGADIIDVGGESTRPGAAAVPLQQELDRVVPVIEAVRRELAVSISVDTSKAAVMREAVNAGANMINDVAALRGEGALAAAAELGVPVCLMHMQGEPRTMQQSPRYRDVVEEVAGFLQQRRQECQKAGILDDNIIIDPGFGFGKTVRHNLTLFQHLPRFARMGPPLLVGVSRKSMFAKILEQPADQRLYGSVTLAALAVWMGASIVRVHDVGPTVDAIKTVRAVQDPSQFE